MVLPLEYGTPEQQGGLSQGSRRTKSKRFAHRKTFSLPHIHKAH